MFSTSLRYVDHHLFEWLLYIKLEHHVMVMSRERRTNDQQGGYVTWFRYLSNKTSIHLSVIDRLTTK